MPRIVSSAGTSALKARRGDLYDTHPVAVHALIRCETLPLRIWEPACGTGNIVRILREAGYEVTATDLNDRGCPDSQSGVDFLMPGQSVDCDGILTNPPFSLDEEFVTTALDRARRVYMLLRLGFMEGGNRRGKNAALRRLALDGGKLARVHVFANRLPMMHRANWTGKRASSGISFAWYCWDRDHNGPTTIDRIWWQPPAQQMPAEDDRFRMMGPDERRREEIKALNLPVDHGPLFQREDTHESQHSSAGQEGTRRDPDGAGGPGDPGLGGDRGSADADDAARA